MFQIDKLSCKKEVVTMIIRGSELPEIVKAITHHGEKCSKSALHRYITHKLIHGQINTDGSIEVREGEGHQIRTIKYPSDPNINAAVTLEILRDK